MSDPKPHEAWANGAAYEGYVGRWSRHVARVFFDWLAVPSGRRWLDIGCGTGALSQSILAITSPSAVKGIDRSDGFIAFARQNVVDPRASFEVGDAQNIPVESGTYDAAVSGLVLNFVPSPLRMVTEMARAVRQNGIVALYVWDYADKMEFMRYFWDAAAALNPSADVLDEGVRFPICKPEPLAALFREVGLKNIETQAIDIPTNFRDFDDYWSPFLGGQGSAPGYVMSLNEADRAALRERMRAVLPVQPDNSIHLIARAWAVRGVRA
ncbi:MAG: methyltransferase domain-containing protein [Chloroflexi bacterium]|nr:methyltransferase domain-containing protein [Chloroflexota bacterium]